MTPSANHIHDEVRKIAEYLDTAQDFDDVVGLILALRDREVPRQGILAAAGWSTGLATARSRQDRLDLILEHRDVYVDLAAHPSNNLPADPHDLTAEQTFVVACDGLAPCRPRLARGE